VNSSTTPNAASVAATSDGTAKKLRVFERMKNMAVGYRDKADRCWTG
jgi:hypothetical protein